MAEQVYIARKTAVEMLEDRGYKTISGIKNFAYTHFIEIYKHFTNYSGVFDLEGLDVNQNRTIIKFIKNINDDKAGTRLGINSSGDIKSAQTELIELYEFLKDTNKLTPNDNIVFIICYGESLHDVHTRTEDILNNCQIFHTSRLIFNVTKHKYVPKHELLSKPEISDLKIKLNIDSVQKLPSIDITDQVARYFNMKQGAVCRIYRPSLTTHTHIFYRVCTSKSDF